MPSADSGQGLPTPVLPEVEKTVDLYLIPVFDDNYSYILRDPDSGAVAVVDPGEAAPILAVAEKLHWAITDILITHHHHDHIGGLAEVKQKTGARVTGPVAERHRIANMDRMVCEGDSFSLGSQLVKVLDLPGHTTGQIGYFLPTDVPECCPVLIPGDCLFAMGCGRLFESEPVTMWNSLQQFLPGQMPGRTVVCVQHEYTLLNGGFARKIDPHNQAVQERITQARALRAQGRPTVPCLLADEWATNPFLHPDSPAVQAALGLEGATAQDTFVALRRTRDHYQGDD